MICKKCGHEGPLEDFIKSSNTKNGYSSPCKKCRSAQRKEHTKSHADERAAANRAWRLENADYNRQRKSEWNRLNRDKVLPGQQRWRQKNKDIVIQSNRSYRAAKLSAGGSFTEEEWLSLCDIFDNQCAAWGCDRTDLTRDHVIPLSKGGTDYIDNIQPLCRSCNSKKHDKYIDYRPFLFGGCD